MHGGVNGGAVSGTWSLMERQLCYVELEKTKGVSFLCFICPVGGGGIPYSSLGVRHDRGDAEILIDALLNSTSAPEHNSTASSYIMHPKTHAPNIAIRQTIPRNTLAD